MESFLQIVQSLGFPAACMVFIALWSKDLIARFELRADERERRMDEEIKKTHENSINILKETIRDASQSQTRIGNQMDNLGRVIRELQLHCLERGEK